MKNIINSLNHYTKTEWIFIKIPFALTLLVMLSYVFILGKNPSYPLSVCQFFDCSILLKKPVSIMLFILASIAVVFYLFEKYMIPSLSFLTLLSIITFSTADSAGIFDRFDVLSLVLAAQLTAYLFAYFNKKANKYLYKNRIQFPIQLIAAAYTLAGLSKLYHSGLSWVLGYKGLALQARKAIGDKYAIEGSELLLMKLNTVPVFIIEHPTLLIILLSFSLFFELFAITATFNKKYAFIWGILLTMMHIGIFISMNVAVFPIIICMIIFFTNPLHKVYILFSKK